MKLTLAAKDEAAAKELGDFVDDLLKTAGKDARVMRQVPGVEALLANLGPKIEGKNVVVSLDEVNTNKVLETVVILMQRARQRATRMQSANAARQIVLAGVMYAADHQGEWPQALEELGPKYLPAQFLKDSGTYEYIKPPAKAGANAPKTIVIYEKLDDGQPVAAGFLDGHVELLKPQELAGRLPKAQQK
jgi:hypothetical protein